MERMKFEKMYEVIEERSSIGIRIRNVKDELRDTKEKRKKLVSKAKAKRQLAQRMKRDGTEKQYKDARDAFKRSIEDIENIEDKIDALKEKLRQLKSQTITGKIKQFVKGE